MMRFWRPRWGLGVNRMATQNQDCFGMPGFPQGLGAIFLLCCVPSSPLLSKTTCDEITTAGCDRRSTTLSTLTRTVVQAIHILLMRTMVLLIMNMAVIVIHDHVADDGHDAVQS